MPLSRTDFLLDFPAFAEFDPHAIDFWLGIAWQSISSRTWGDVATDGAPRSMRDVGIGLFTAHQLAVEERARRAAEGGGVPGAQVGVYTGGGAAGASVSYDVGSTIDPQDASWNLTTYGAGFIMLAKQFGSGGLQL